MNKFEIFKREILAAGFETEMYRGQPAVRVSELELNDVLAIVSVECETKKMNHQWLVFPK